MWAFLRLRSASLIELRKCLTTCPINVRLMLRLFRPAAKNGPKITRRRRWATFPLALARATCNVLGCGELTLTSNMLFAGTVLRVPVNRSPRTRASNIRRSIIGGKSRVAKCI